MKIIGKPILGFVLIAMLGAIIGVFGIINLQRIEAAETFLYKNMTVPVANLLTITEVFQRIRINVRDYLEAGSSTEAERFKETIDQLTGRIEEASTAYEKEIVTEAGRKVYDDFVATRKGYRPAG